MSINRSDKVRFFRAGAAGLLAGCLWFSAAPLAAAQDNAVAQQGADQQAAAPQAARTDADIQSDVGYALTHDATLQGQQISATTAQGTVTITGTVQTDAQRQQAETIAAGVQGVAGILNSLKVTNPGAANQGGGETASASAAPQVSSEIQSQVPPPPPDGDPNGPTPTANQGYGQGRSGQQPYNGARPPYQPQGGYYPPQQGYGPPPQPSGPITVPAGTLLRIRLSETLDTARIKDGAVFQGTAAADIYQGGVLAIPRGAVVTGLVVESKNAGELGGSAVLRLQLTNVNLEGKVFPLATDTWSSKGPNKAGYTASNTAGGAVLGAIIGGIVGRGAGAAIGAGVGGAAGLATSAGTRGPRLFLPTESQVDFHLANPVTVQPVSWQEAQRLATNVPQAPRLVQRPRPVYLAPYPYGYPYPY